MNKIERWWIALAAAGLLGLGCSTGDLPTKATSDASSRPSVERLLSEPVATRFYPAPRALVTVQAADRSLRFWPYTGTSFSGEPQDPINLIFFGKADPRDIRATLLALDGDRTALGFPAIAPFNARWDDAIGDVQTGYGDGPGWTGGAIQLACGAYGPVRFHLRLFRMGEWTVGNAHFELLIPGTTEHQVLSWEIAEQFVVADLMRSGRLDGFAPVVPSGSINDVNFRSIPAQIYNLLPAELRGMIGGPMGQVADDVPIGSDGVASVLHLASAAPRTEEHRSQSLSIQFDQTIPKPFCSAGPYDYVYVTGQVSLHQTTYLSKAGQFRMTFWADGALRVQPIDPLTGSSIGEPMGAQVHEHHEAQFGDRSAEASSWVFQQLSPSTDPASGSIFKRLIVSESGLTGYRELESCATQSLAPLP